MGNVLSGDEKFSHLFAAYDRKPREIVWIDDQFGYRPANKSERKAFERRTTLYYDGNKEKTTRKRSHSLGAIIGELYSRETDLRASYQGLNIENSSPYSRSFLPRIKLNRDMPIKEDNLYSSSVETTYNDSPENRAGETSYREGIIYNDEVMDKPEENYFTKNFDECMKRLQIIEKEQEIMEADAGRILNVYNLKKSLKRQMTPPAEECTAPPPEREDPTQKSDEKKEKTSSSPSSPLQLMENEVNNKEEKPAVKELKPNPIENSSNGNSTPNQGWYSNLKRQFELEDGKTKETSCRVTGATLKNPPAQATNNESKEAKKHYFSRLVRSNKSLIDEELPDPDKVQNIRAMFQESLNSTLQKNFNNRFGGSLQNINVRQNTDDQFARPKSAQGNRNEFAAEFGKGKKEEASSQEPNQKTTESQSLLRGNAKAFLKNQDTKGKTLDKSRKFLQPKWTDTTSLSSGVSSDLSSYDTDAECCSREEIEESTTDDELQEEDMDKHYVETETLEKIRSFGTSVTYFGGQMITCSVGPLLSPTTQAILEEIGEKYPHRKNFTRTFEEFYRKYTENNEVRRKKLGRTRSFGQSDVFHKPNILNNTEIEMYKNDLETEIGIRKPSGRSQNTLKQKLVKSNSIGSRFEFLEQDVVEKLNEILEAAVELADKREGEPSKEETEEKRAKARKSESPKDEIHFGYGKEAFKREHKSDMEFEEFEVCETVEEKMEKLEETPQSYRLTIQVNQEDRPVDNAEELEEIIINDQEPLDSLEIYLKGRKGDGLDDSCRSLNEINEHFDEKHEYCHAQTEAIIQNGHFAENPGRSTGSKWPIETTVMVDIQKNEEQTPKLLQTGKSIVKTKTRSFKKRFRFH